MLWGYEIRNQILKNQALNYATVGHFAIEGGAFLNDIVERTYVNDANIADTSYHLHNIVRTDHFYTSLLMRRFSVISPQIVFEPNSWDAFYLAAVHNFYFRLCGAQDGNQGWFYLPCHRLADGVYEAVHVPKMGSLLFQSLCHAISLDRCDGGHFVKEHFLSEIDQFIRAYPNLHDPVQKIANQSHNSTLKHSFNSVIINEIHTPQPVMDESTAVACEYSTHFEAVDAKRHVAVARAYNKDDVRRMAAIYYLGESGEIWPFAVREWGAPKSGHKGHKFPHLEAKILNGESCSLM